VVLEADGPDAHPDPLSIAELYGQVDAALSRAFPRHRSLWVRGEIQSVSDQARTGHCYIDLIDPDSARDRQSPVLRVKCWRTSWAPLRATLRKEGIELSPGMVVMLRGTLDFYRARAEIGFIMAELDVTSLLGRMAAQRAALLRALEAEGLLEANRRLTVPAVPMRIALVGSPGTEGFGDFVGQVVQSGLAFRIGVVPVAVQGTNAPRAVARALARAVRGPCDLIVLVRGGGSKADLATFDTEAVARAVATSAVPIWTGIGHTGDQSVTDIVANRSFVTPTECGRELALRVGLWWDERVAGPASVVGRRVTEVLTAADHRDALARGRLTGAARHQLRAHGVRLAARADRLAGDSRRVPDAERQRLAERTARLEPCAEGHLQGAAERIDGWRRLLAAYDVTRQLERGYTLTLDASGGLVRSGAGLRRGDPLVTLFADGSVASEVSTDGPEPGGAPRAGGLPTWHHGPTRAGEEGS
jgi:exodeoxyribonuclease VII large subunit